MPATQLAVAAAADDPGAVWHARDGAAQRRRLSLLAFTPGDAYVHAQIQTPQTQHITTQRALSMVQTFRLKTRSVEKESCHRPARLGQVADDPPEIREIRVLTVGVGGRVGRCVVLLCCSGDGRESAKRNS
jgi:hypothetical protein